jgi:hypothetical protein
LTVYSPSLTYYAFFAIRYLSQLAEVLAFRLQYGQDLALSRLVGHCSDRAEHIAQHFTEVPLSTVRVDSSHEVWVRDSVADDVAWMVEVLHVDYVVEALNACEGARPTVDDLAVLSDLLLSAV